MSTPRQHFSALALLGAATLTGCAPMISYNTPLGDDLSGERISTGPARASGFIHTLPAAVPQNALGRTCTTTARVLEGEMLGFNVTCPSDAFADAETMRRKQSALGGYYLNDIPVVEENGVPTYDLRGFQRRPVRIFMARQKVVDDRQGIVCDIDMPMIEAREVVHPISVPMMGGMTITNRDLTNGATGVNFVPSILPVKTNVGYSDRFGWSGSTNITYSAAMNCTTFTRETPIFTLPPVEQPRQSRPSRHAYDRR